MAPTFLFIAAALTIVLRGVNSVSVICYYESWSDYDGIAPEDIDPSLCTHINYAFITVWPDGNLKVEDDWLDIDQGLFIRVTNLKQKNPNMKVLLSVGGADSGDQIRSIAGDAGKRGAFIGSATYFVGQYNFDGLDIDWEYPESGDTENYITLLTELKAAFQPHGWLLTAAVSAEVDEHGYDCGRMNQLLDYVNIMTYDFYGSWSTYTGQNSPLFASSSDSDWEKQNMNVAGAATKWANCGIPNSKLSVGTGFYGRSFTLADQNQHGLHAPISGVGSDGGEATYLQICTNYDSWTRVWDDEQKNPYKYSGNQWIGYDDRDSIWAKADWAKNNGFFGVMIWAIDGDDVYGKCGEAQLLLKQINRALA